MASIRPPFRKRSAAITEHGSEFLMFLGKPTQMQLSFAPLKKLQTPEKLEVIEIESQFDDHSEES